MLASCTSEYVGHGSLNDTPAVLAGVTVVLRERPQVEALLHVVESVNRFADAASGWSLARACQHGAELELLRRIVARKSWREMHPLYLRAQLTEATAHAAARGQMDVLLWLLNQSPKGRIGPSISEAAARGDLRMLKLLCSTHTGVFLPDQAMLRAAQQKQFKAVQWLHQHARHTRQHSTNGLVEYAAAHGDLSMVRWLLLECGEWPANTLEAAANYGHLNVLQWVTNCLGYGQARRISMDDAASNGHLHVLRWLQDNGGHCTSHAMDHAARNGHLTVVQWLHAHRVEGCTTLAMDAAATHGHLEVVQWLHTNRSEGCSTAAMDNAACNGHLEVVRWLHGHRFEGCTTAAMDGAARGGHLETLRWLHEHRYEGCTTAAADEAARCGHLDVMQWLETNRPHDGRFSNCALLNAASNGHLSVVKWLYRRRNETQEAAKPWSTAWGVKGAMDGAASEGHLHVLKWLHLHHPGIGSCSTEAMDGAASNGHLRVVEWLHENRFEGCTTRAMDRAAGGGHFHVLLFLHAKRSEGCTSAAAVNAALQDRPEILQWLFQSYPLHVRRDEVLKFSARYSFHILDWMTRLHS